MPAHPPAAAALDIRSDAGADDEALYPSSDGRPMAENTWQERAILNAAGDLGVARPEALVAADILVYPEEGNDKNRVAPDVLAAFGVGTHNRSTYRMWKEGKPPDWVLEVASPGTVSRDLEFKPCVYATMGVREYWLFDAKGGVFPRGMARLRGLKLADGKYEPLPSRLRDGVFVIRSEVLRLDLRAEGELIRFRDPATREDVRHRDESEALANREAGRAGREAARANQEAARADREAAGRLAAEARVAELEAALRRWRTGSSDDRP